MKTFDERTNDIMSKIQKQKRKQRQVRAVITLSLCFCVVAAAAIVLFTPYNTTPPDVSMYADSDYYELIQQLNQHTYQPPQYKNNYEYLISQFEKLYGEVEDETLDLPLMDPPYDSGSPNSYIEITDNQVQGVVEADLIKRSDSHIYYLRHKDLSRTAELIVNPIYGSASRKGGNYTIDFQANDYRIWEAEMYLSDDCTTVTVFMSCRGDIFQQGKQESFECIVSLDVTDPTNIKEVNRQYITGFGLFSRKIGDTFLVMFRYDVDEDQLNFDDITTFLPQIGQPGNMTCIEAKDIVAMANSSPMNYYVVLMIDENGLVVTDVLALLAFGSGQYVSENNIYVTRYCSEKIEENVSKELTEISCISYAGDKLEYKGSVVLEGGVKDQYSMDEHEGILRVVTSTTVTAYSEHVRVGKEYVRILVRDNINVNLYCVDLTDFSIKAKVEAFAPEGESAQSVRFDGDKAYVCTAEVITLRDPVYVFDLSDLSNITWKDTGTINGYSSSLVNFGDYLLGIGYNENRELKIEVYRETENGVESVCKYELAANFSEDYKSYLIDRERQLVGLALYLHNDKRPRYLLLGFDGMELKELSNELFDYRHADSVRAVLLDNLLWVFSDTTSRGRFVW